MNRLGKLTEVEMVVALLLGFGFYLSVQAGSQAVILASIPVGFAIGWNYRYYLIDQVFYVVVPAGVCALWTARGLQESGIVVREAKIYGAIVLVEILSIAVTQSKKRKNIPPPKENVDEVPED